MYSKEINIADHAMLPQPKGYKILVAMPKVEEKTEGGIIRPDSLVDQESVASMFGNVIRMGPDAYADKEKFPNGAYCKEGDWVMFRSYAGTRFRMYGYEFRLLNDDTVEAVVDDPRGIERI